MISHFEIHETLRMFREQHLDVRTITMGISLLSCADSNAERACQRIYDHICWQADKLVSVRDDISNRYGIPIVHTRVSVTPISIVAAASDAEHYVDYAIALDKAADTVGVDYIGGFTALVHKGISRADKKLIDSIPAALNECERVCASVNVASTRSGINMNAVYELARSIKLTAEQSKTGAAGAKLVVFANVPEDNPFMAGAFHGVGETDAVVHVGVSGPGAIYAAMREHPDASLDVLAETIKRTAFKISRVGQLVLDEASRCLGIERGIVDLSLAPTPEVGDSVARIIEEMGIEGCGAPGSTAALALLTDAVKKGGMMASSNVGGLSGAFLPVSEDSGMAEAVRSGSLCLEKLEAMTAVCSVGLDMIVLPGDSRVETIAAIIADEMAIGVVNNKTTAARLILAIGKQAGDTLVLGGLLGESPVLPVSSFESNKFIARGGRIPAPSTSVRN